MTRLLLREGSPRAVIWSLVHCSKSFESSYDPSFSATRISTSSKALVSFGMLQGAAEATRRAYDRVSRVMRLYPEAFQLLEKVNEEASASDSAGRKGRAGFV